MDKQTKPFRIWTYTEASQAVPYVRVILHRLRENFITIWHLYRMAGYDPANPDYCDQMKMLREESLADLDELKRLGILPYERPSRGIALFPFVIDDAGKSLQAYFVYKDSRDTTIESFVFNDVLCETNDLFGNEWPVPGEWKQPGVVPRLREVLP